MLITAVIDNKMRDRFTEICKKSGFTAEMAVMAFVRTVVDDKCIPFDLTLNHTDKNNDKTIVEDKPFDREKAKKEMARLFEKRINIAIANSPDKDPNELREKILEDICDINETTNISDGEYFRMKLYRFDRSEWMSEYLGDVDTRTMLDRFNVLSSDFKVSDKYEMYKFFKDYYKRDVICVRTADDIPAFKSLLIKHPKLFIKPVRGTLGRGVEVVTRMDLRRNANICEEIFARHPEGILVEEYLEQHPVMASFNPYSLNSLRILTIRTNDDIKVYGALRVGTSEHITDAASSGGVTCGFDLETGEILRIGRGTGEVFYKNPGNGAEMIGVKIPDIEGAIKLAKELAMKIPNFRYVGWDIALTKDRGWVMIELNGKSGVVCVQTAMDRGIKKDVSEAFKNIGKDSDFPILERWGLRPDLRKK